MSMLLKIGMNASTEVNRRIAQDVCTALKQRYGEEFEAVLIGDRLNTKTTTLYMHPVSEPTILFTARIDHDGCVTEDYVSGRMMKKINDRIRERFEQSGIQCLSNAVLPADDISEQNTEIREEDFYRNYLIEKVLVYLVLKDGSFAPEMIIDSLEHVAGEIVPDLVVYGYVMGSEMFQRCEEDILKYPSLKSTRLDSYQPEHHFIVRVENGKSSLSGSELRAKWEVD